MDGCGVPLSLVVTGANRHDVSQLELVLDEIIIERPQDIEQHLCADKGYDGQPALDLIVSKRYIPHVKRRGEEIQEKKEKSWMESKTREKVNLYKPPPFKFLYPNINDQVNLPKGNA